jgi:DNA-binding NarL/FixJ family response regulator
MYLGDDLSSLDGSMSEIETPPSSATRRRILLADDHPLVLKRVTAFLQSTFDVVGVAHNGLEMVAEAMRLKPDIIVADISMPELDGIQAAHRLREMGASTPLVFLTIHENSEFLEACRDEGGLGFVVKSHMKADLIPAIDAALAGRSFVSSARHD